MTIQEFQRIVLRLSNSGHCRHWLHFNHPENPAKMAIQVVEASTIKLNYGLVVWLPVPLDCILELGFKPDGLDYIYTIDRTNEDGTPYVSRL